MQLEGVEFIIGVPYAELFGDGAAAKMAFLRELDIEGLWGLVREHGFFYKGEVGMAIAIPPKYAMIVVSPGHAHGLKWQFIGTDVLAKESEEAAKQLDNNMMVRPRRRSSN